MEKLIIEKTVNGFKTYEGDNVFFFNSLNVAIDFAIRYCEENNIYEIEIKLKQGKKLTMERG